MILWTAALVALTPRLRVVAPSASASSLAAPELVLPAAAFAELLQRRTWTAECFEGVPLDGYDVLTRSLVLNTVARRVDASLHPAQLHPLAPLDPAPHASALREEEEILMGSARGSVSAARLPVSGWLRGGRRIASRAAQLSWERGRHPRWRAVFRNVPPELLGASTAVRGASETMGGASKSVGCFDELLLVLYTPRGIYIHTHDRELGLTGTSAPYIQLRGPRSETDWREALDTQILPSLDGVGSGCERVAFVSFDDHRLAAAVDEYPLPLTSVAYGNAPLARSHPRARAATLRDLVRELDERIHPGAWVKSPYVGTFEAEYDWLRDNRRVLCKSAQLKWDQHGGRWRAVFRDIKLPLEGVREEAPFDELMLALYTPRGVYVYRHDLELGVTTQGKATAQKGHAVTLYGPPGPDWRAALDGAVTDGILPKLDRSCERISFVFFR